MEQALMAKSSSSANDLDYNYKGLQLIPINQIRKHAHLYAWLRCSNEKVYSLESNKSADFPKRFL